MVPNHVESYMHGYSTDCTAHDRTLQKSPVFKIKVNML